MEHMDAGAAQLTENIAQVHEAVQFGLSHADDAGPGIIRRRAGKGFTYADPKGRKVEDPAILSRIRALAIPPAWTGVWISPDPDGHIQATGRDAKGRFRAVWLECDLESQEAATALLDKKLAEFAQAPPEEPPAERDGSHGLRVTP